MGAIYRTLLLAAFLSNTAFVHGQDNTCLWHSVRAASVQGTLYANGGFWNYEGTGESSSGISGNTYTLDLSKPFNTINNTGLVSLFTGPTIAGQMSYLDGIMFASSDAYYLFGYVQQPWFSAMTHKSHSGERVLTTASRANQTLGQQVYPSTPGQTFSNGTFETTLAVSNYIATGAGVNIPSESLGFYFSGLQASGGVEILSVGTTGSEPNTLVNSMIRFDMSSPQNPTARLLSLSSKVAPRSGAELVWIPVSSQGLLIAIGGLTEMDAHYTLNINFTSPTHSSSPDFMTSLPVYDIASDTWFVQETSGVPPPQRALFCSTVTNTTDPSSFEIYIFGGLDGTTPITGSSSGTSMGDVWVLSVPSFTWTRVYGGDITHSRDMHVCVRAYSDRMLAVGGENSANPSYLSCLDSTIDVFNLTSSTWISAYDPSNHSEYEIPPAVASNIKATPTASGMDLTLRSLFAQPYSTYIPTYYPYAPTSTPSSTHPTPSSTPLTSSHNSNKLGAILGSVLGVLGALAIILTIWYFCRPKRGKRSRVHSWIKGVEKTDTSVATDETLVNLHEADGNPKEPSRVEVAGGTVHPLFSPKLPHAEADGTERYEMSARGPGSAQSPVEMATSFHFGDHPERLSAAAVPGREASLRDSHGVSAPSPPANPQGSSAAVTKEATATTVAGSSSAPSPPASPPFDSSIEQRPSHNRHTSSMSSGVPISAISPERSPTLNALERISGLGYSSSRPRHTRNLSSMSSGQSNQPVSPAEPAATQNLQSPTAEDMAFKEGGEPGPATPTLPPVSHEGLQEPVAPRNFNRNVVARKKLLGHSVFSEEEDQTSGPS